MRVGKQLFNKTWKKMARRKGVHRFDTDQHRAKSFIFNW